MKTAVVTGATGFIGGALARRLLYLGYRVVTLCRDGDPPSGCEIVRGELEDMRSCERLIVESGPDEVYHLAAQAIVGYAKRDPWSTFESNVRGTYNFMEACRRHVRSSGPIVPIVVASSDKAYGHLAVGEQYKETDPLSGSGFYDCSKACTDMIAQCYGRNSTSLPVVVVRAGNVYGPGDDDMTRIVPSLVRDAVNVHLYRRGDALNVLGYGTEVRDYLYIDDAVEAYQAAARYVTYFGGVPQAFNVAGGEAVTTRQLAETLSEVCLSMGTRAYPEVHELGDRAGEIQYQALDTTKAWKQMSFRPSVTLRDGLRRTLEAAIAAEQKGSRP